MQPWSEFEPADKRGMTAWTDLNLAHCLSLLAWTVEVSVQVCACHLAWRQKCQMRLVAVATQNLWRV
jgi:hypothetical protein